MNVRNSTYALRPVDGSRSYYLLDGGPDVLIAISIFDSSDAAVASNERAADCVRHNVLEFTRDMPTSWWAVPLS